MMSMLKAALPAAMVTVMVMAMGTATGPDASRPAVVYYDLNSLPSAALLPLENPHLIARTLER